MPDHLAATLRPSRAFFPSGILEMVAIPSTWVSEDYCEWSLLAEL